MIDLNITYSAIGIVMFSLWGMIFVFGAGSGKAIKPFLLLMAGWFLLLIGHLIMDEAGYQLPSIHLPLIDSRPEDTISTTLLSMICALLMISLLLGFYRICKCIKRKFSYQEDSLNDNK